MSATTRRLVAIGVGLGVAAVAVVGWRAFWFLTDDAFIAFRYASNAVEGYGLVWNPPPFRPVEGYTSFLWVTLLAEIWKLTGAQPPEVANTLSLWFGLGSLALCARLVGRFRLPEPLARHRLALTAVVLFGTVCNRTFLTWLSSGLETALFNFALLWWVTEALARGSDRTRSWVIRLSTSAAIAALTRPDGLLAVGGTVLLLADAWGQREAGLRAAMGWLRALPLAATPVHVLWRHSFYGEWLPNTFYAKHVAAWPESGWRYLASFTVENGVWVWLAIAALWLVVATRRLARAGWRPPRRSWPALVVAGVLFGHFSYYTWIIGGDHFEYRVYSHLPPLLFASGLWMLAALTRRAGVVFAALSLFFVASLPVAYVHWSETRHLDTRRETHGLARPIAARFPAPLRPIVGAWDDWQSWLVEHHVGMRHQEHKLFWLYRTRTLPGRSEGAKLRWSERPVTATNSVGVVGWVLPGVAVIDTFGLNDRVIARAPVEAGRKRLMAHDRHPPIGYVKCFRPNVFTNRAAALQEPRSTPLTDDEIRACEARDWYALHSAPNE